MRYQALADGFFNGARRRKDSFFHGPDGLKASWFVASPQAAAPEGKVVSKANPKGKTLPGQADAKPTGSVEKNVAPVDDSDGIV